MSGTKKSIDIESIRRIFKQRGWDNEFWVMGNLPYNKGTKVFWQPAPGRIILTQEFDSNYQLFQALLDPKYHPRRVWPVPMRGLFESQEWVENTELNRKLLIKKILDQWEFCEVMFTHLGLPVDPTIRKELTKILHKLN
jgi:hypothetical protein